jgi:hypothetical protein
VTGDADLERGYRRWLRCYPAWFRRDHEAEILEVLMAGARDGQRRPALPECLDLVAGGLGMVLRPRVARSNRPAFIAVRLMYLGAVVELATVIAIVASSGQVRSAILARDPGYSATLWHDEVTRALDPLVVGGVLAIGLWLWLAWANGRGHRWARVVFALFFCLNTYSLATGVAGGSAVYARVDLVAGSVLWLVQLAAVVLVFHLAAGAVRTSPE